MLSTVPLGYLVQLYLTVEHQDCSLNVHPLAASKLCLLIKKKQHTKIIADHHFKCRLTQNKFFTTTFYLTISEAGHRNEKMEGFISHLFD